MNVFRRRVFLIDPKVQGSLAIRIVAYWFYALLTISLLLICWDVFTGPTRQFIVVFQETSQRFAPAAIASLLVVPLVVMDVLRLSNRFAGPAWRLKNALHDLAAGKDVGPLSFRDDDFWKEIAASFNGVAARLQGPSDVRGGAVAKESAATFADEAEELLDCESRVSRPLSMF
jgi:hypothetical protein